MYCTVLTHSSTATFVQLGPIFDKINVGTFLRNSYIILFLEWMGLCMPIFIQEMGVSWLCVVVYCGIVHKIVSAEPWVTAINPKAQEWKRKRKSWVYPFFAENIKKKFQTWARDVTRTLCSSSNAWEKFFFLHKNFLNVFRNYASHPSKFILDSIAAWTQMEAK